ncbi:MAG: YncE family protein [Cytophagales bacterium]|nr:YncE family protein [Cytophagales bacterium]
MLCISIFGMSSCMMTSDHATVTPTSPELNINYPAAYVVNGQSNDIYVIALSSNEVKEVIKLGASSNADHSGMNMANGLSWPHHIYMNPSKTQLSVAAPGMDLSGGHDVDMMGMSGKFAIIDPVKGTITKVSDLPMSNHNAAFSPDGTEIWTTQMDEMGKVLVFNSTDFTIKSTIPVGGMPAEVTFSWNGSKAFVCNGHDSTVSVIDPSTKQVISTLKVGAEPVGAWPSKDGNMYVDNEKGKTVTIINVATLSVIGTINLGFMPGYVAYNEKLNELWITDPTAGKVHYWIWDNIMNNWTHAGEFATGAGAHAIAFIENGMTGYVTNQAANTVSVIDVMNHIETKKIMVGTKPNGIIIRK